MDEIGFPQFREIDNREAAADRVVVVAREIRAQCGQARRLPFDPRLCAQFFGLDVLENILPKELSGRLSWAHQKPTIELQSGDSEARKRFTLCHELAHLSFFEGKYLSACDKFKRYMGDAIRADEEKYCDRIAAELLMPRGTFRKRAIALEPSHQSIEQLGDVFGASRKAVLTRLLDLRAWSFGYAEWELASLGMKQSSCRITVNRGNKSWDWTRRQISDLLHRLEHFWARRAQNESLEKFSIWRRQKSGILMEVVSHRLLNCDALLALVFVSQR